MKALGSKLSKGAGEGTEWGNLEVDEPADQSSSCCSGCIQVESWQERAGGKSVGGSS